MSSNHTPNRLQLICHASQSLTGALNCLEMARAEPRRHVAFWLLDVAAARRRSYATTRAAIAKAAGRTA